MHLTSLFIQIHPSLYERNPADTGLGKKIISGAIQLIDELGFEAFTFKKLGNLIGAPESSIYRYFKNKHQLLMYLTNWYWGWLSYKLQVGTLNLQNSEEKLDKALDILLNKVEKDADFKYIDEQALYRISIAESVKAFHTKLVDEENDKGYFDRYKQLVKQVSQMILAINPAYPYPMLLTTTIIEGINQQRFFETHLPALIDLPDYNTIKNFYKKLVKNNIGINIKKK